MRRRQGFTLVELLVAMALIIFMMLILSEAFSVGLDSFRRLKAVGDMNSRLRNVNTILRSDLAADHFEGRKRISAGNLWTPGPPREGFFRIWQGSLTVGPLARLPEGTDGYGLASTRATDHMLHFTIKLLGNEPQHYLSASVPAGSPLINLGQIDSRYQETVNPIFNSQWAEVTYFLRPNNNVAGTTPLYALYRRQRLVLPENQDVRDINWGTRKVSVAELPNYLEVSCQANPQDPGFIYFNTPMDLTVPQRRFGMNPAQVGGVPYTNRPDPSDPGRSPWTYPTMGEENPAKEGDDILMTDVISFEVQIWRRGGTNALTTFDDVPPSTTNPLFDGTGTNPRVYDSWSNMVDGIYDYSRWREPNVAGAPAPPDPVHAPHTNISIHAIKVTLRVWDVKTAQTRQITIIQDM